VVNIVASVYTIRKKKNPSCSGCGDHKGHPFWGECKLYACVTEHEVEHCGLCTDFPCDLFVGHFEGPPDSIEGQRDAILRLGFLAYRKKVGIEKYFAMIRKLKNQE
jgi:hypothetical protein